MTDNKDAPPDITERYSSATHASSLVVTAERGGAGDMLIAAGWSKSRLGAALMRLHSEWDGTPKPRRQPPEAINALASRIAEDEKQAAPTAEHHRKARAEAAKWHTHEVKIQLGRLKTLPEVREQLRLKAIEWAYTAPEDVAAGALMWWLDPICPVCHGQRWEVIPGTPSLGGTKCKACHGTGERSSAHGVGTVMLVAYINDCVSRARADMKPRLRRFMPKEGA